MAKTYRFLAYLICALVGVQAASHAWGSAGIGKYVADGGVIDKAAMAEGGADFPEILGLVVHGMNGMMFIPFVTLVFVVVAALTKVPAAIRRAVVVAALVALQVTLGLFGHGITILALLHGFNALVLFACAFHAGLRAPQESGVSTSSTRVPVSV
jgi:heme A synthase